MLCARAFRNPSLKTIAREATRSASTAEIWGHDSWRYDKKAFKQWVKKSSVKGTPEERQLYAYLASCFGDCDVDKDGSIDHEEFDVLLEVVAALPRRFGFAPNWRAEYGTRNARQRARMALFNSIDGANGFRPRGKFSLSQFMDWARDHIAGQSPKLKNKDDVALRHVGDYTVDTYVSFLAKAVSNPMSAEWAGFYNYLLTSYVEADAGCEGQITFKDFNKLIDYAAKTPRYFELAPMTQDEEARKAMFEAMDPMNNGFITFRRFLHFVREHVTAKIDERESK